MGDAKEDAVRRPTIQITCAALAALLDARRNGTFSVEFIIDIDALRRHVAITTETGEWQDYQLVRESADEAPIDSITAFAIVGEIFGFSDGQYPDAYDYIVERLVRASTTIDCVRVSLIGGRLADYGEVTWTTSEPTADTDE